MANLSGVELLEESIIVSNSAGESATPRDHPVDLLPLKVYNTGMA